MADIQGTRYGYVRGDNPSGNVTPPKSHQQFRYIDSLSGGTKFVYIDIDEDEVELLTADFDDYQGKSLFIREIHSDTDCAFLVSY